MGIIPREFINDLLARVDIVDIISARIPLRKNGSSLVAHCPFHTEKTPSFNVLARKQFYRCFGCGKGGNVITFLMDHDRLSFVEAIETLARHANVAMPSAKEKVTRQYDAYQECSALLAKVNQYYQYQLKEHAHAMDYLKARGLNMAIIEQYGLGFAPPGWENVRQLFAADPNALTQLQKVGVIKMDEQGRFYDLFTDRIMFPIYSRKGAIIGFGGRLLKNSEKAPKYLNSPTTPLFQKGHELYGLYQMAQLRQTFDHILMVEGYMDVLALAQFGIANCVATLGTAATPMHMERLFRETNKIVFCFDGDNAGRKAAWKALEVALPFLTGGRQVQFMFLPAEDDPDSLIRKEGLDFFKERIHSATPLADYLLSHLGQQADVSTIDGRARFAQLAKPMLELIPDKVYQQVLFDELARITHSQFGQTNHQVSPNRPYYRPTVPPKSVGMSLLSRAVSYLIQNPNLIQLIQQSQWLFELDDPESQLLMQVVDAIQEYPDATMAALIEHWRDDPQGERIMELASVDHLCPVEGLESEFLGIIRKLREDLVQKQIKDLYKKHSEWTDEDRASLMRLIVESKE